MGNSLGRGTLATLLVLFLLAGCGADSETRKKEATASQQLAYAYLQEKNPSKALMELAKAEALTPDDPEIKNGQGLAYWAKHEYQLAEKKFLEAVALDETYSEAWNNLGAFYIDQARFDRAVSALQKALSNVYYSTSERALTNLGWAYYKLGRLPEAKEKLTEAAATSRNFPLAHKNLGIVLQDLGDHQGAIDSFDKTLKLYNRDQETYFYKGVSQLKLGDRPGARTSFEEAWKLGAVTEIGKSAKNYMDLLQTAK